MSYGGGADYGWGSTGGSEGAPPAGGGMPGGGAPPGGPPPPPQASLPNPEEMSVRELKAELMNLGVDFTDCYEKSELVNKLRTVQEKQRNVLQIDARTTAPASAAVIFLHGLGDQAAGWLAPLQTVSQKLPHVRFLLPNAPMLKVTMNGGQPMPAWFDVTKLEQGAPEDSQTIEISNQFLLDLVKDEISKGVKPERIVIAGFSQGGAVALNTLVRAPQRLAGAFALSAWLPCPNEAGAAASAANKGSPIGLFHGDNDNVVATAWGKSSADALKKTHPNTEYKTYAGMGHQSNAEEMADVAAWLLRVIP